MDKQLIKISDEDLDKEVNFTILTQREKVSAKGTPMISLGLRCTNNNGVEFEEWVNHTLFGTEKCKRWTQSFLDCLDTNLYIEWDGDTWNGYTEDCFKFAKGKCTIVKNEYNGKMYYNIGKVIKVDIDPIPPLVSKPIEMGKSTISDCDIPF